MGTNTAGDSLKRTNCLVWLVDWLMLIGWLDGLVSWAVACVGCSVEGLMFLLAWFRSLHDIIGCQPRQAVGLGWDTMADEFLGWMKPENYGTRFQ